MNKVGILALALAGACLVSVPAATVREDFSRDPAADGWRVFGDTNLFRWDATNQDLAVTWDSTQPNSYFYHPLDTILAKDDQFSLAFDLQLRDARATNSFEIAVGLLRLAEATNAAFSRPFVNTPDLFEFDYFPDGGYGPSLDATLADDTVSATNSRGFSFDYANLPLVPGVVYHVQLTHLAGRGTLSGEVSTNGQVYTTFPEVYQGTTSDFRLDTLAISSYSASGDTYGDSLLAHGIVDNLVVTLPPPPVQDLAVTWTNGQAQLQFIGRTNWLYTLQRSLDLQSWTAVAPALPGFAGTLTLTDTNAPPTQAFYRIQAARP